jgi:PAS domain S-box-containing protein
MISLDLDRLEDTAELGRALIARIPGAGLLIVDRDLTVLLAEGDAHRGREQAVLGRTVPEVIPPAAWTVLEPRYRAALRGEPQLFEYNALYGGSTHSIRLSPVRGASGVIGAMVLSQDVTATARTTRALAESDELQRSVLEALDEGVIVVDLDGLLVQANRAASEILREDVTVGASAASWWERFAPRHARGGEPLHLRGHVTGSGEALRDVDAVATRADGTTVHLSLNYQPLRAHSGEIRGLVVSFRDVSARELEHQRLVEIQEQLREAHEVARLASWEWEPAGGQVTVFHALAGSGTPAGTRMGLEDLLTVIPAAEREGVRADLVAIERGDSEASVRRFEQPTPDGPIWLETRARAVRDGDGRLLRIRGTSQDVTEQEAAKRQAAAERDFLQATLDSLPAHIVVLDADGAVLMANRGWTGFAAVDGLLPRGPGGNYLAACDAAEADWSRRTAEGIRAIAAGHRGTFSIEYRRDADGRAGGQWFQLRAARFEGPGEATVVVAHDDVTQRREAEAQVVTQAALLDEVDVAVVATDTAGRITHWNSGAERLYGWTFAEVTGRGGAGVVGPATNAAQLARQLEGVGQCEGELLITRRDGSTFPGYLRGRALLDGDGGVAGHVGVVMDMSRLLASERALRAARDSMRAVTDSMGEGLFTLDVEGRVTYMNRVAEELLGWSQAALEGRVLHDVAHAADRGVAHHARRPRRRDQARRR